VSLVMPFGSCGPIYEPTILHGQDRISKEADIELPLQDTSPHDQRRSEKH
jgi:hypothetical protein